MMYSCITYRMMYSCITYHDLRLHHLRFHDVRLRLRGFCIGIGPLLQKSSLLRSFAAKLQASLPIFLDPQGEPGGT